jgi:uncharacterized membrane protein YkoI
MERERGFIVYEAETDAHKVYLDARTGRILYQREED